ncbi:MAG: hypothetical protein GX241_02950 [Ruminococcaceae bacterium]|jgi:Tfp pilus assembly protein PilE|nr:hypothetical protein [Oscillospiraceae bacterium]
MKVLSNNKGLTLVEIIVGFLLFAIAGVMFAQSFASTSRLVMRAALFKSESASASSSVELEEAQEPYTPYYTVTVDKTYPSGDGKLTVTYEKGGVSKTITMKGAYVVGKADAIDSNATITYREFLPSNFSFEVPAEIVDP